MIQDLPHSAQRVAQCPIIAMRHRPHRAQPLMEMRHRAMMMRVHREMPGNRRGHVRVVRFAKCSLAVAACAVRGASREMRHRPDRGERCQAEGAAGVGWLSKSEDGLAPYRCQAQELEAPVSGAADDKKSVRNRISCTREQIQFGSRAQSAARSELAAWSGVPPSWPG